MERSSYVVDYNQLMLGCNPVVWKTGTCCIDQRDHVRKRSAALQSSFGINTKVCSLLLVLCTFPFENSTTNTRAYTHKLQKKKKKKAVIKQVILILTSKIRFFFIFLHTSGFVSLPAFS